MEKFPGASSSFTRLTGSGDVGTLIVCISQAGLGKEQTTELEQQLSVCKARYREAKDELEEVRALVEEHKAQMEEYRNKYMQAQQTVEEQRRQIDMMELENSRIGEQVNLEIQRVKNQFQEKLQELTPLPDILKATQKKLQEVQQMHLLAERKNELLLKDLQTCRDKVFVIVDDFNVCVSLIIFFFFCYCVLGC